MGLKDERKIVKIREGKIQEHTVQLVKSIFGLIVRSQLTFLFTLNGNLIKHVLIYGLFKTNLFI